MARTIYEFFIDPKVVPGWYPLTTDDILRHGDRYIHQTSPICSSVIDAAGMPMSAWVDKPNNQMRSWVYRETSKRTAGEGRRLALNPIFSAPLPLP